MLKKKEIERNKWSQRKTGRSVRGKRHKGDEDLIRNTLRKRRKVSNVKQRKNKDEE